jgi:hypothetical protein
LVAERIAICVFQAIFQRRAAEAISRAPQGSRACDTPQPGASKRLLQFAKTVKSALDFGFLRRGRGT